MSRFAHFYPEDHGARFENLLRRADLERLRQKETQCPTPKAPSIPMADNGPGIPSP